MDLAILIVLCCLFAFEIITFVVGLVTRAKIMGPFLKIMEEIQKSSEKFNEVMDEEAKDLKKKLGGL